MKPARPGGPEPLIVQTETSAHPLQRLASTLT
jgi:hypothetical protein